MSHLRPGTIRVNTGDLVRQGDIIAFCGNSGRSPEPHLHFQMQLTALPGAKTVSYPFSYFLLRTDNGHQLRSFEIPSEGDHISNVSPDIHIKAAFDFQPGTILKFRYTSQNNIEKVISWEVFTDSYNNKYIYCIESQSTAFFVNDGTMFYFTSFYGDHKSLLYYFYLTSYKVLLGYYENIELTDLFPLHIIRKSRISLWVHDFIAPFYQFINVHYSIRYVWADSPVNPGKIKFSSKIRSSFFSSQREEGSGTISLSEDRINEFSFDSYNIRICAQRAEI
jgi:murein DD-endopeptidase MepM/ murein hydrolase activator NlpD